MTTLWQRDSVSRRATRGTSSRPTPFGHTALDVLRVNGSVIVRPGSVPQKPGRFDSLTDRERQVLALVAEGFTNKAIGSEMGISERTVKNRLARIMAKLNACDRTHAVVTAVRLGWLAI